MQLVQSRFAKNFCNLVSNRIQHPDSLQQLSVFIPWKSTFGCWFKSVPEKTYSCSMYKDHEHSVLNWSKYCCHCHVTMLVVGHNTTELLDDFNFVFLTWNFCLIFVKLWLIWTVWMEIVECAEISYLYNWEYCTTHQPPTLLPALFILCSNGAWCK